MLGNVSRSVEVDEVRADRINRIPQSFLCPPDSLDSTWNFFYINMLHAHGTGATAELVSEVNYQAV